MTYHEKVSLACNYHAVLEELTRQINETKDETQLRTLWTMRGDFSDRIHQLRKELGLS